VGDCRQPGDRLRPPGYADIRVASLAAGLLADEAEAPRGREGPLWRDRRYLLVEDRPETAVPDGLEVRRVLNGIQVVLGIRSSGTIEVLVLPQRPQLHLGDLEDVKDAHRHRVRPLVREMPPDPDTEPLVGLPDVDRLAVIVVEGVAAPLRVCPSAPLVVRL
jgi:hypothetical protein